MHFSFLTTILPVALVNPICALLMPPFPMQSADTCTNDMQTATPVCCVCLSNTAHVHSVSAEGRNVSQSVCAVIYILRKSLHDLVCHHVTFVP